MLATGWPSVVSDAIARWHLVAAASFSAGLAACGGTADEDPTATGRWFVHEQLRLTGTPEQEFGRVLAVAADEQDDIYVLDIFAQAVNVFDSDGTYTHSIGRPGEGPGELSGPRGVAVGPDGRIWIPDQATARISVFESHGALVAQIPRRWSGSTSAWDRSVIARRSYIDWRLRFPGQEAGGSIAEVQLTPMLLSWDEETSQSPSPDSFPSLTYTQEMAEIGGRPWPSPYFDGDMLWALDGLGAVWFAHSREYRLYKRSLEGDTVMVVTLDEEAAPVTREDVQAVRDDFAKRPARNADDHVNALPAEKPIILALFADAAGNVFVIPETRDAKGGTAIDAFGPAGEYWGRAELPEPINPPLLGSIPAYATSRYLLLGGTDAAGEPYVVRLGHRR